MRKFVWKNMGKKAWKNRENYQQFGENRNNQMVSIETASTPAISSLNSKPLPFIQSFSSVASVQSFSPSQRQWFGRHLPESAHGKRSGSHSVFGKKEVCIYLINQTPYVKNQRNSKVLFQILKEERLLSFIIIVKFHKDCIVVQY